MGLALLLAPALAAAQATAPASPVTTRGATAATAPLDAQPAALEGRENQRVEKIHHEDARVVIDEVRYAGQTQSIRVKPKSGLPAYEVQPGGTRVWNVFGF